MSVTVSNLAEQAGRSFGPSRWIEIEQERINAFADATLDHQWIHVDPERAAAGPFGTTIAHGYLTLSLVPELIVDVQVLPSDAKLIINYGLNRVRFPAPVPSGSRVRGTVTLESVEPRADGRYLLNLRCVVEVEGGGAPAVVADVIYMAVS